MYTADDNGQTKPEKLCRRKRRRWPGFGEGAGDGVGDGVGVGVGEGVGDGVGEGGGDREIAPLGFRKQAVDKPKGAHKIENFFLLPSPQEKPR